MSLNETQLMIERFFYDEIITGTFADGQIKIKQLNSNLSLEKVDNNGNFVIKENNEVIASFSPNGLEFKE